MLVDSPATAKLHVHGVIVTDDGERIALFATGCANMVPGTPISQLRENIRLHCASEKYAWVNDKQFWGTGQVDLSNGQITIKTYMA